MAQSYHNFAGLYRDLERARRAEPGTAGAAAWEQWLELLDISLEELDGAGVPDGDGLGDHAGEQSGSPDHCNGPPEGRQQLRLDEPAIDADGVVVGVAPCLRSNVRTQGAPLLRDRAPLGGARRGR